MVMNDGDSSTLNPPPPPPAHVDSKKICCASDKELSLPYTSRLTEKLPYGQFLAVNTRTTTLDQL